MNTLIAAAKLARIPNEAMAHVFSSMKPVDDVRKAVDSHCASSCPSPNAPMRDGRATFTMVAAIIAPTAPSARMPISPQRRATPTGGVLILWF